MLDYAAEWLTVLLRWTHVVAAMAWIGASFHFVWLEWRLGRTDDPRLPAFKWEAYWTWLTGFLLLATMYYAGAEVYLVDRSVLPLDSWQAVAIGLCSLAVAWMAYDQLCKSRLARHDAALAAVLFLLALGTAWALCRVFAGRGAFIHYGAILGTVMAANVAHVVIPHHRERQRAQAERRVADPGREAAARQRSLHNTFLAAPAVIAMLSSHHAMLWAGPWNWLVLGLLSVAGALARAWFLLRHRGRSPAWPPATAALCVAAAAMLALRPPT